MKNTFRALFGVSALAFLLVATPVLAAEVDVTAENHLTGADSDNDNDFDIDHDIDVDVDNDGDVDNEADADVNTGDNEQEENTTAGDIDTGSVDASTDWESIVNAGTALGAASDDGLDVTADFSNDTTGADSDNENNLDVDHDVDLDLDNTADIWNKLNLDANTGDNEQEENTTAGDITTGDISLDSMIANWANNDSGFAGAHGGEVAVDVTAENHLTGADSDNENNVDVDSDVDVDIDNDADIDNKVKVHATTGDNEQERNTTGGSISTGSVEVSTAIENGANNGGSMAGVAGHSVNVTVDASNDTTGADSDNENNVDVDSDVDVDIDNDADIDNELDVCANTGDNEQEENTTGGDIDTGDVTIDFNVSNEVNSN